MVVGYQKCSERWKCRQQQLEFLPKRLINLSFPRRLLLVLELSLDSFVLFIAYSVLLPQFITFLNCLLSISVVIFWRKPRQPIKSLFCYVS